MENVAHPALASRDEWLIERKKLLDIEKKLTHQYDEVNALRRRLPMVKLNKEYIFEAPQGNLRLVDLFEGRRQLIVYHFMFDPAWDTGCPGCTGMVDALGNLDMLAKRNTTYVLISRAPLDKLLKYKHERGWNRTWVSSFGSDFNYDFHVTLDRSVAPLLNNYREEPEMEQRNPGQPRVHGETHGLSVFFRIDNDVYHTYSTFARGCEGLTDAYHLLDVTPYGRQEDFENSPAGFPQKPTYA